MIGMAFHLRSFTKLAGYLEQEKGPGAEPTRAAWIEHRNLVYAETLQQAAREMTFQARANDRVQKPVLHLSISWAPEDHPTEEQMRTIAGGMLEDLGISAHQASIVAHEDKPYAHVHIMANRVHPQTCLVAPRGLYWRQIHANTRHNERAYGFREVPSRLFRLDGQRPPDRSQSLSRKAWRSCAKRGEMPFQFLVQEIAGTDFQRATSWAELTRALARSGLLLKSRKSGLVVTDGLEYAKSSSIGPGISRRALEHRYKMTYAEFTAMPDVPNKEMTARSAGSSRRALPTAGVDRSAGYLPRAAEPSLARGR